jgi:hypothetical protein
MRSLRRPIARRSRTLMRYDDNCADLAGELARTLSELV